MRIQQFLLLLIICHRSAAIAVITQCCPDPEIDMTTPELIRHWGYPVETYSVVTKDAYVLYLHRIPYGRRPIVLLQHGLLCSSAIWVTNLPHQSAGNKLIDGIITYSSFFSGFLFADAGFDVWLGNMRGNTYSRQHLLYDPDTDERYWKFSWDHMAQYDLDAMVDGILSITNRPSLNYIGHSQGVLTMLTKLSIDPLFNHKISKFFALAPVSTLGNARGLLQYIAYYMYDQIELIGPMLGYNEFMPNTQTSKTLAEIACGGAGLVAIENNPLCTNTVFQAGGPESNQLNRTRLRVYMGHVPAGTSIQNILHYCQMIRHGRLQAFDYGSPQMNIQSYGQALPPIYDNIASIQSAVYLYWSGGSDWLANEIDIQSYLIPNLRSSLRQSNNLVDFSHMDFIWGLRAADEIYWPIVRIIRADEI